MYKIKNVSGADLILSFTTIADDETHVFLPTLFSSLEYGRYIITGLASETLELLKDEKTYSSEEALRKASELSSAYPPIGLGLPDTIEEWDTWGQTLGYDYKYVRDKLKVLAANWGSLTAAEQKVAATYVATTVANVASVFGADTLYVLEEWEKNSSACRITRWRTAKLHVFQSLPEVDTKAVLVELTSGADLVTRFIAGIEGTVEDGVEGLFDYVEARVGTSYEGAGLATINATLATEVMVILKDGNYD